MSRNVATSVHFCWMLSDFLVSCIEKNCNGTELRFGHVWSLSYTKSCTNGSAVV